MIRTLLERIRFALKPPAFEIVFENGTAWPRRGKIKRGFLEDCTEIARMHHIADGRIRGIRHGDAIRLDFSREIPAAAHQRLRNAWQFHT
jgi:hypothetical protein